MFLWGNDPIQLAHIFSKGLRWLKTIIETKVTMGFSIGLPSLKLTAILPLKIGRFTPQKDVSLVFQASIFGCQLAFVSGRVAGPKWMAKLDGMWLRKPNNTAKKKSLGKRLLKATLRIRKGCHGVSSSSGCHVWRVWGFHRRGRWSLRLPQQKKRNQQQILLMVQESGKLTSWYTPEN